MKREMTDEERDRRTDSQPDGQTRHIQIPSHRHFPPAPSSEHLSAASSKEPLSRGSLFPYLVSGFLQAWLDCFIHVVTVTTKSRPDNKLTSAQIPVKKSRSRPQMSAGRAEGK
ncbi:MAG: hypothetical protein FRX48_05778 [Lasallia pustulata]|uniref:Uncharacterized protein n=1 Tax=Lasallia pustulata TaxID=136370 RepID=A0A5M8PLG3_9LECA|nr:MAG: hypothetical protein FRX48_05778 [Lasallia pustulata]